MGVHHVVGEDAVDTFDYTHIAVDSGDPIVVVAGMPIDPLFPVNFGGVAACETSPNNPQTQITQVCLGGANDGSVCADDGECTNGTCTDDALFVDRVGTIWAIEGYPDDIPNPAQSCKGGPNDTMPCVDDSDCRTDIKDTTSVCRGSAAAIRLFENWAGDIGCQPWRSFADVPGEDFDDLEPYPIVYRPGWPETDCNFLTDPFCPYTLKIGETNVSQTDQCGRVICPHNSAGVKLLDTTHEVRYALQDLPPEVDFRNLPPHLFGGTIGGTLEWPDRIRFEDHE